MGKENRCHACELSERNAELQAEVERLRACLQRIVDHHEDQRGAWESIEDADNRDYHEQRRNVALMALRGEGRA